MNIMEKRLENMIKLKQCYQRYMQNEDYFTAKWFLQDSTDCDLIDSSIIINDALLYRRDEVLPAREESKE